MRKASLRSKYLVLAVVLLGLLVVVGCNIDNLTGPISVNLGETATYSMRLLTDGWGGSNLTPVVAMDVPIGWTLTSSSYTGTANGVPVSGSGTVVGADPTGCYFVPATPAGYQRIFISTAAIPTVVGTDSATVSVTFLVGGAPSNYTLSFWHGGRTGYSMCQQSPTTIAVSVTPAPAALQFYSVTPCRQLDTRSGLPLASGETLTVPLTGAPCGVPSGAISASVNLTVTQQTAQGFLTVYPADQGQPTISNINFKVGPSRANNANLLLSSDGTGSVKIYNGAGGTVHVILDVNGYFQ